MPPWNSMCPKMKKKNCLDRPSFFESNNSTYRCKISICLSNSLQYSLLLSKPQPSHQDHFCVAASPAVLCAWPAAPDAVTLCGSPHLSLVLNYQGRFTIRHHFSCLNEQNGKPRCKKWTGISEWRNHVCICLDQSTDAGSL